MSGAVVPRLYYMPRTRSSRVLWLLEEIDGPTSWFKSAALNGGLRSISGAIPSGVSPRWSSATAR